MIACWVIAGDAAAPSATGEAALGAESALGHLAMDAEAVLD